MEMEQNITENIKKDKSIILNKKTKILTNSLSNNLDEFLK